MQKTASGHALIAALWFGLQAFSGDAAAEGHYICQHASAEGGGVTTGYVYCYWEWDYEEITNPEGDWNMPGGGGGGNATPGEVYTIPDDYQEQVTRFQNCETDISEREEFAIDALTWTEHQMDITYPVGTTFVTYFSGENGARTGYERWTLTSRNSFGNPATATRTFCQVNP